MDVYAQKAYFESFANVADFFIWYNWAKAIYTNENPPLVGYPDGIRPADPIPVPPAPSIEVETDLYYFKSVVGKLLSVSNSGNYEKCLSVIKVEPGRIYYEIVDTDPFELQNQITEVGINDFSVWCDIGLGNRLDDLESKMAYLEYYSYNEPNIEEMPNNAMFFVQIVE